MDLSIIIPFSPQEDQLKVLLSDLEKIPLKNIEIILVGENDLPIPKNFKNNFVKSKLGRGVQQNYGAKVAKGKFLWFLHADSRIRRKDFDSLKKTFKNNPNDIIYLNLKFLNAYKKMWVNEIGTKIRSDLFKLPFGDQGLGVSKENFQKIAGFPQIPFGEDLLFVRKARKIGLKIKNCRANIYTSARKYEKNGWIKTTLEHLFKTLKLSLIKAI